MRLSLRYVTTFTYDTEVSESHNCLRACPAETPSQRLIRYHVDVSPAARIVSYRDYWGTRVDSFGVVGKHTRLTVAADAEVETSLPSEPNDGGPWREATGRDELHEYLARTPHASWTSEITTWASDIASGTDTVVELAVAIKAAVGERLEYSPGVTEVGISVADVFSQGRGVCQDYAHLALAAYRSLGVAARYVSGYLYAAQPASGVTPTADEEIEVATHAWVEVHVPGHGWWGLDPTNQLAAGERHVKIGHGRDYEDVTPLRGVYHGAAESGGLEAKVKMSPRGLEQHRPTSAPAPPTRRIQSQQ